MKEIIATKDVYVICHNNLNTIHCFYLKKGHRLITGQPFIEERNTVEEIQSRVDQIAKESKYFNLDSVYNTGE